MTTEQTSHEVRPIVVQQPRSVATWIIAVALSVIATCLLLRPDPSFMGSAFGQTSVAGSHGIHAFTGQLDRDKYGLFMMDVDNGTVWVYEYYPMKHRLKLACARSFAYDRYLADFNNDELTSPEKIKDLLERQQSRRGLGISTPSPVPAPEAAAPQTPSAAAPAAMAAPHATTPPEPAFEGDPDAAAVDALGDDWKIENVGAERDGTVEKAPGGTKNP